MNKIWDWPMIVNILQNSGVGIVEFRKTAWSHGVPCSYKGHVFMTTPLMGTNPTEYVTLRCLDAPELSVQGSVRRSMLRLARKKTVKKCHTRLDKRMEAYLAK